MKNIIVHLNDDFDVIKIIGYLTDHIIFYLGLFYRIPYRFFTISFFLFF